MLEDVLPSRLREALDVIPVEGMPGTLVTVTTVEDAVREADLVIDFVPDELESKLEIMCLADRMAPPKTVICIQTSALSVSDLASCTYRAERCIGVALLPSGVQLALGTRTSPETVALLQRFFQSCGMPLVDIITS
jgi:3-hydroxybutyryl-CoA dehydrogenase